jgi:hypothetical protein
MIFWLSPRGGPPPRLLLRCFSLFDTQRGRRTFGAITLVGLALQRGLLGGPERGPTRMLGPSSRSPTGITPVTPRRSASMREMCPGGKTPRCRLPRRPLLAVDFRQPYIYIGDIYLIPSVLSNIGYASTSQSDPARTVRRRTFLPVFLLFWAPVRRFSRFQSMLAVARTSQSPPEIRRRRRHLLPPDFPVLSSPLLAPSCYRRRPRCPPRSTVRGRSRSGSRLASPLPATQSVPAQLVRRRLPPAPPDRYRSVKTIQ